MYNQRPISVEKKSQQKNTEGLKGNDSMIIGSVSSLTGVLGGWAVRLQLRDVWGCGGDGAKWLGKWEENAEC